VAPELEPRIRRLGEALRWVPRLVVTVAVLAFVVAAMVMASPLLLDELEGLQAGEWRRPLVLLVFVIPFLALPGFMLRRIWRRPVPAAAGAALPPRRRLSSSTLGCFLGPALFLVAGLGLAAFFLVPLGRVIQALGWDPVSCEVLSSSVDRHQGGDEATYSVEVRYRYEVDGRSYQGRRYRFLGGSSSGSEAKQRIVDSLPPGAATICWVDPDDPREAVLDRGLSWEYVFGLLPLAFVALGAVGLYAATAGWRGRTGRRAEAIGSGAVVDAGPAAGRMAELLGDLAEHDPLPERPPPGELVLEPEVPPLGRLGCLIGVALVWNGLVGAFVWMGVREPDPVLGCFLVPFVLVGLGLLVGVPYQILALANPRPHLRLADGRLSPGRSTTIYWSFSGAARHLRGLQIRLEGREVVRYSSGDSTSRRTEVFARLPLADETQRGLLEQGSARLELPAEAMHSFDGRHGSIVWVLVVHGTIARWPDVGDEFEVTVLPEAAR
jgi:hypothetical protein